MLRRKRRRKKIYRSEKKTIERIRNENEEKKWRTNAYQGKWQKKKENERERERERERWVGEGVKKKEKRCEVVEKGLAKRKQVIID